MIDSGSRKSFQNRKRFCGAGAAPTGTGGPGWHRSNTLLILGLLLAVLAALPAAAPWALAAAPTRRGVVILPFQAQRPGGAWLAAFLGEGVRDSLHFSAARWPLLGSDAAAQWAGKLALRGLAEPAAGDLGAMGVDTAVQGTVQLVLRLVEVRLRVTLAGGPRPSTATSSSTETVRFDLVRDSPAEVVGRVLTMLPAPGPGVGELRPAPQPASWARVEAYYRLRAQPPAISQPAAVREHMTRLDAAGAEPALRARASAAMAGWALREALLTGLAHQPKQRKLRSALQLIGEAVGREPWNTDRLAVKGEIHYFLRQDFEARSDASVARLKNPLNGLAFAVMAFTAGLSSGEATEKMTRALKVDPFLESKNRPRGEPPFQDGAVEGLIKRWRVLRARAKSRVAGMAAPLPAEAIAHFEKGRWREAAQAFGRLAEKNEYDHRPHLYLQRILIQTGRAAEAAEALKTMAIEFPQEAEIHYFLAIALQRTASYAMAEAAFRRSLEEDPSQPRYLYGLATGLMALERWEEALETLRRLLENDPRHEQGWLAYGMAQFQLKKWGAADDGFARVLQLNPEFAEAKTWREKVRPLLAK